MTDGLVWIVDDSSLMEMRGPDLKPSLAEATQATIDGFLRRADLPRSLLVAVIAYREGEHVGHVEVGCRPAGSLSGLVTLADWNNLAWPYQKSVRGKGTASCEPAFAQALAMIRDAARRPEQLGRVVVVHVTTNRQDQGFSVQSQLAEWKDASTLGCGVSIFHLELLRGTLGKPPVWYPTSESHADSPFRKWLFETATVTPPDWPPSDKSLDTTTARGIILRAKKADFEQFVELLGRTLRERAATVTSAAALDVARPRSVASPEPLEPRQTMVRGQRPLSARVRWCYSPVRLLTRVPYGPPIYDPQGKIVASSGASLVAFDGQSGQVVWRCETPHGEVIASSPALGGDGSFRVHGADGMVTCVDDGGRIRWSAHVGTPNFYSTPVVDARGNTYAAVSTGGIWKIDDSGDARPFYATDGQFEPPPVIFNSMGKLVGDRLFIGGDDHCVHAIGLGPADSSTELGTPIWDPWEQGEGRTHGYINAAITRTPSGELVVASSDDHLWAFHESGAVAWKIAVGGLMIASPVVDPQGLIYAGVNRLRGDGPRRGHLVQIDPRRRSERQIVWVRELESSIESIPVIGADGMIYAADRNGVVYAFLPSGEVAWKEHLNATLRSGLMLTSEGLLVVSAQDGTIYGLNCASEGPTRTA